MSSERDLTGKLIYAARLCRTLRASMLLDHGLHAGQDLLLKSLSRTNGQTMGSLAADLGVRPPTITKMVTRMEAQGLVVRQASGFDNRLNLVHVTPAGEALLARIDEAWRKADTAAFEKLKDKDSRRLNKILDRILASLAGQGSQGSQGRQARREM
jgi:MarR family transcriptional regulator, organic hydroperoxide resistance regulator